MNNRSTRKASTSSLTRVSPPGKISLMIFFLICRFVKMNDEERESLIRSWHDRANAYQSLINQYDVFQTMTTSLIDLLEKHRDKSKNNLKIMDFGSGTGLVSKLLIEHLGIGEDCFYLIDPAENMCEIARKNLPSAHIYQITGEKCLSIDGIPREQFDFILSNAAMHLMSEKDIYPVIARLLKCKTGRFLYTLWYHAFDETIHYNDDETFEILLDEALEFFNYPPLIEIQTNSTLSWRKHIRSRNFLHEIAQENRLEIESIDINRLEISIEFLLDFLLMNCKWLNEHLEKHRRNQNENVQTIKNNVLQKLRELLRGKYVKVAFVNVALRRVE